MNALRPTALLHTLSREPFHFWMACSYLFFEYVRPQSIWPTIDVFPWTRSFVLLALAGWILNGRGKVVWTSLTSGVIAFLGVITVASHFAYWPEISRRHYMGLFSWVVIFFMLTQTVTSRRQFMILLGVFMVASFKLSFFGARTWAMTGFSFSSWGLWGPEGYFNNPGELAIQMVVFAPIALFFGLGVSRHLPRWQTYILYAMPLTAAMTVLATNTRGGQIALAAQVLALLASARRFKALLLVGIIAVIGFQLLPEQQFQRFRDAGDDETSVQRLLYWKHGWTMIKDHPLLGVGYFNFSAYYTRHHSQDLVMPNLEHAQLPHNIVIQVGTDAGFAGLAILAFLLLGAVWTSRRAGALAAARGDPLMPKLAIGLNISLLGFVVGGQFVTVTYYPFLWIHLAFVTILWTVVRRSGATRVPGMRRGVGTVRRFVSRPEPRSLKTPAPSIDQGR
jgi:putative inorganic carbon (hco3(-)) transporter